MLTSLPPWSIVTPARAEHIARVVRLVGQWAEAMGVGDAEAARWRRAALLHDALRDAGPEQLARWTPRGDLPVAFWHGPAAAAAAEAHGDDDPGVLEAVRWHSLGHARWDSTGRMLYLADYLEPGRGHERERLSQWAARVPHQAADVLREVAAHRLSWAVTRGRQVHEVTWHFWNSLAGRGDGSSPPASSSAR